MKTFIAEIDVMPQPALLDPQGKAVNAALAKLGLQQVSDTRVGKHITLTLSSESTDDAHQMVEKACKELLANPIMEFYRFSVKEI